MIPLQKTMGEGIDGLGEALLPLPVPPSRLFERLAQIPGYTWDQSIEPFHSVSPRESEQKFTEKKRKPGN